MRNGLTKQVTIALVAFSVSGVSSQEVRDNLRHPPGYVTATRTPAFEMPPDGTSYGEIATHAQAPARDPAIQALELGIAGREQQPAEQVFKNIRIFKGMPAIRVLRVMEQAFVPNLGVTCSHCHVPSDWSSDERPAKSIARAMWTLRARTQDDVRAATGNASAVVTCYTCHKGQATPSFAPGQ